jgi:two-component system sensor histidine kinase/response regulator
MKKILVVEDDDRIREDIAFSLSLNNYDTLEASNGFDAIELAKNHLPSLIISDIMMPKMDGYELLLSLQQEEKTASIPFLFLSAKTDKSDIRKGMNLGADDYITKPFDLEDLVVAVETRLKKKEMAEKQYQQRFEDLRSSIRSILPHEIRTPLNAILGFTDFMLKNPNSNLDNLEDMLSRVYSSAKRLNILFENYMVYANLEIIATNQEEIEKLTESKTYFVKNIIFDIAMYKADLYKRKGDLDIQLVDGNLRVANEFFVKSLEELIDNAFKFSDINSSVSINSYTDTKYYTIEIADHGIGFTPEQIKSLGAYVQFDRKIYEQQGSGIGLTITKRIADLHQGKLEIIPREDGTTVILNFLLEK